MRDLEFRAWMPKDICPDTGKDYGSYMLYSEYHKYKRSEALAIVHDDRLNNPWCMGLLWMQFTGILDKHGKKVFEGDILRPIRHNAINRFEIKYYGCAFMVFNLIRPSPPSFLDDCTNLVVCGNIYEHPHLLEQNNE